MIFLGIDPGKSGGISRHDRSNVEATKFTNCTPADVFNIIEGYSSEPCVALIEKVASSEQMGRASSFAFGKGYGFLLGVLTGLKIPFEYIAPATWQGHLKCRTGVKDRKGNVVRDNRGRPKHDKNITKQKAQELFPHLKITHAIADALLIGEYHKRTYKYEIDFEMEL